MTGFNHTRPLRSKNDEIAPTVAPPSVLRLSGIHHWTLVRSTVVPVCLRPGMVKKTPESEKLSSKFVLSGTLTIVAKALTQVANYCQFMTFAGKDWTTEKIFVVSQLFPPCTPPGLLYVLVRTCTKCCSYNAEGPQAP